MANSVRAREPPGNVESWLATVLDGLGGTFLLTFADPGANLLVGGNLLATGLLLI